MKRAVPLVVLTLLALPFGLYGAIRAYSVAPSRSAWSGWADTVAQTVTCC